MELLTHRNVSGWTDVAGVHAEIGVATFVAVHANVANEEFTAVVVVAVTVAVTVTVVVVLVVIAGVVVVEDENVLTETACVVTVDGDFLRLPMILQIAVTSGLRNALQCRHRLFDPKESNKNRWKHRLPGQTERIRLIHRTNTANTFRKRRTRSVLCCWVCCVFHDFSYDCSG